jgi:hypothetical protein
MQHPTFSATLAEQHREALARQACDARLARSSRPKGRLQWRAARWWRPATRPARA